MSSNHTVPGYETTYNHYYRPYCLIERDPNIRYDKKIVHLLELDAEVSKKQESRCKCSYIAELKNKTTCDLKAWHYLADAKTEYVDKMGSLWQNFTIKSLLPKNIKRGMKHELDQITPVDPPTYIYTLEENKEPKKCSWWVNSLAFSDDLQCRVSREYQKRQFLLSEKVLTSKS